jgi:branched-chain amino acid transport system permease protein
MDLATGEIIINGPQGITGTPKDATFTIAFIVLMISLIVVLNLIHSRDGRAIMSVRDNAIAAESAGINVTKYKLIAFTISAVIAGFAGALYAHNLATLIATPARFGYNMSIMFLVFVVLGGIGSTRGSIIAAVVLTLIPEVLRFMANYRMLIYSIVLIVIMLINWSPSVKGWLDKNIYSKIPFLKKFREKEGR